jgi:hypothetical protein
LGDTRSRAAAERGARNALSPISLRTARIESSSPVRPTPFTTASCCQHPNLPLFRCCCFGPLNQDGEDFYFTSSVLSMSMPGVSQLCIGTKQDSISVSSALYRPNHLLHGVVVQSSTVLLPQTSLSTEYTTYLCTRRDHPLLALLAPRSMLRANPKATAADQEEERENALPPASAKPPLLPYNSAWLGACHHPQGLCGHPLDSEPSAHLFPHLTHC